MQTLSALHLRAHQPGGVIIAASDTSKANMISGILIFNQKGENLIFRAFRNDCRPRLADVFRIQVISNPLVRSPILTLGSTTFSHVKHENIFIVAVTKGNANAALVFEFLYRLTTLGKSYFGKFDEEAVKNNFVLIYELLDGMRRTPVSSRGIVRSSEYYRDPGLWIPPKHGNRHAQDVHHHRGCQVGAQYDCEITSNRSCRRPLADYPYRRTRPRLLCRQLVPCPGDETTSNTARTKPLSTL